MPWETYDTFTVWSKVTAWVIVISCWLVKSFLCFLEPLLSLVLENPDVPIYRNLFWFWDQKCNQVSSVIIILSSYFCPPTLNFCKKCFTCLHPLFLWLSDKSFGPHLVHTQLITMFIVRIVKMNNLLNLHEDENYLKVRCLSFMTLSWIQHFVFYSHIAMVFHFLQHLLN